MNTTVLSIIIILAMLASIFLKLWIGTAMSVAGLIGIGLLSNWNAALLEAGLEPFVQISSYTFTCIPLFVLMGAVISNTGLGSDLFECASKFIGHIRGGLAMASVAACGIFAAVCGSSYATAVTMGRIAYPEMKKYKYNSSMATACLAAGGTIGFLIPPSICFIVYGLVTEESIGKLFMAGFLPGFVNIFLYCVTIYILCKVRPDMGPPGPKYKAPERVRSLKGTWPIVVLLIVVFGGIYGGIFTASEAGAVGSAGAIALAAISRKLTWKNLEKAVSESVSTCGMFIVCVVGSYIFMRFLTLSGLPATVSQFAAGLQIHRIWILLIVIVIYLILGSIFEIMSAVMLTVPITYPLMCSLGYDPIWFGVIVCKLCMIGQVTPPIGMNCFVLAGAVKEPIGTIFKGIWPFFICDLVQLALLVIFPEYPLLLVK